MVTSHVPTHQELKILILVLMECKKRVLHNFCNQVFDLFLFDYKLNELGENVECGLCNLIGVN